MRAFDPPPALLPRLRPPRLTRDNDRILLLLWRVQGLWFHASRPHRCRVVPQTHPSRVTLAYHVSRITRHVSCVMRHMSCVQCHLSKIMRDTPHVTRDTSRATMYTSPVTRHASPALLKLTSPNDSDDPKEDKNELQYGRCLIQKSGMYVGGEV